MKAGLIDFVNDNTSLGYLALNATTGNGNTALGSNALVSNTSGVWNTAIGAYALGSNIAGVRNTAIGQGALYFNTGLAVNTGERNTAIGEYALFSNTGQKNTAVGFHALVTNTTGDNNTAVGYTADVIGTGLTNATAIGYNAKVAASNSLVLGGTGADLVKVGIGITTPSERLDVIGKTKTDNFQMTTGATNLHVLQSDASGNASWVAPSSVNTNQWYKTGNAGTTVGTHFLGTTDDKPLMLKVNNQKAGFIENGNNNTSLGYQALNSISAGIANTAHGHKALFSNIDGHSNTAIGASALRLNTVSQDNTAIGANALYNNTGNSNTAIGFAALQSDNTGQLNTAVGYQSLFTNTTGNNNTAIGYQADVIGTGLTNATAIGNKAKVSSSNSLILGGTGADAVNVGIGTTNPPARFSVNGTTTGARVNDWADLGSSICGLGYVGSNLYLNQADNQWKWANTHASQGGSSIQFNTCTADKNAILFLRLSGASVAGANATPLESMRIDQNANVGIAGQIYSGTQNTVHGYLRLRYGNAASGEGNIYTDATYGLHLDNSGNGRPIRIDGSQIELMPTGNVGIGIAPTQKLHVAGNGLFTGTVTASCGLLICSDIRYKKNFLPVTNALKSLQSIHGIYYNWDTTNFPDKAFGDGRQIGFSAQELELVYPEIVHTNDDGFKSVDYSRLTPVLVEAIKDQQVQIEELKSHMIEQDKKIELLMQRIGN